MKKILANILPRLVNKFKLRATGLVEELLMDETIQPTTSVDELLVTRSIYNSTVAISGAVDVTVYTVPTGKRLTLKQLQIELSTGVYLFNAIKVLDASGALDTKIENFTAASIRVTLLEGQPLTLEQGWSILVSISSYTSPGNLAIRFIEELQDAF